MYIHMYAFILEFILIFFLYVYLYICIYMYTFIMEALGRHESIISFFTGGNNFFLLEGIISAVLLHPAQSKNGRNDSLQ